MGLLVFTLLLTVGGVPESSTTSEYSAGRFGLIDIVSAQSVPCDGLVREAEEGTLVGNFVLGSDANASGGTYVWVPEGMGDELSGPGASRVDLCFTVTTAGSYNLQGYAYTDPPGGFSDSFFVTVDDIPVNGYLWDIPSNTTYAPSLVTDRVSESPLVSETVEVTLSAGTHIVSIFHREDGARLDKLELVAASAPVNQAPTVSSPGSQNSQEGDSVALAITANDPEGDTLTFSAIGLPAGLTIDPASGQIAGTVATGSTGFYNVTVTADDGNGGTGSATFLWTVGTPPQACDGLMREAEAGTLVGNFVLGSDANASGGTYAWVPEGMGDELGGPGASRVDLCFTVTTAGSYQLQGYVYTDPPGGFSDSYYVTVDGVPVNGYLWDTPSNTTYAPSLVTNRVSENPLVGETVEVTLSAGTHIVSIFHREDGARLDKLELVATGGSGNQGPTVSSPGSQNNQEGDSVALAITANDPEGDTLTFDATGLPAGLTIDPASGQIVGTVATGSTGFYNVTVTADDGTATAARAVRLSCGRSARRRRHVMTRQLAIQSHRFRRCGNATRRAARMLIGPEQFSLGPRGQPMKTTTARAAIRGRSILQEENCYIHTWARGQMGVR